MAKKQKKTGAQARKRTVENPEQLLTRTENAGQRIREMEAELEMKRQRLQGIIEEFETSQEAMKASNKELQSANEELRSMLEELETSKEELQSMNEELQTVNQENRHKVEELAQLSGDLQNLLAATDIATLFLDREMRVLRFTPKIGELFNIRAVDRGRPISHLTHRLGYDHLLLDAQTVLNKLHPIEREVPDLEGHWYFTRVLPYRSTEDRIEGIVITFIEITQRKHSEDALRHNEEALRQLNQRLEQQVLERTAMVKLLQDITRAANESRTFDEAICLAMDRILQVGRWKFGRVWRRDLDETSPMKNASLRYHSLDSKTSSLSPEKQLARDKELDARAHQLAQQVLATLEPQWGQWLPKNPEDGNSTEDSLGKNWTAIAFPIVTDHQILAILLFFSPTSEEPEKQLLEILPDIGIQLGHVARRKELENLVADAAEREQQRIGRDIHDGVGQELTGLRHLAHTHAEQLEKMKLPESKVAFRVADGFKTVQQQLRSIIRDLIPVEVDSEGLVAALRGLAERTTQLREIPCLFRATKPLAIKNTLIATHIYRIAQEAVSNAVKHANAKEILIELYEANGNLILRIADDGMGFSTSEPTHDGYGIRTMSFRAELLGGHLRMSERPQGGTEVHCAVPFTKSLSQKSDG